MRVIPLFVSALALSACGFSASAQDGEQRTSRDFNVGAFEAVSAAGSHDVIVAVGGAPSVRAEGSEKALDRLDIRVENGTLKIGQKKGDWSWGGNDGKVVIHVSAPRITAAALAGSGDLSIDKAESQTFKASLAGSGDLKIGSLKAEQVDFDLAGSGDIEASGGVGMSKVSLAGSGGVAIGGLNSRQAQFSIAGSGNIDALVTEAAAVSIAGSGNVNLKGGAKCTVSKRGSGNANCS